MAQKNLNITELDFDKIKENLITYFSSADSPFSDWKFSGSGLNILVETLAYNTHYNAMIAHMGVSEAFIDSAQLRSSVVSLARLIGYTPRSYVAPIAKINATFITKPGRILRGVSAILPKGSPFTTSINETRYVFVTTDDHLLIKDPDNDKYVLTNIEIKQGAYSTKRFQVNNASGVNNVSYEIDDFNIDLSTLIVKVFPSASSVNPEVFTKLDDIVSIAGINENTPIYFVSENADGNYRLSFGNNIFGKQLSNLSIIEITYLTTSGALGNGAREFTYAGPLPASASASPNITTVAPAEGGSERESIESVRYNAPLSFVTQNRAVTSDDYKNLILKQFSEVETISVWGGEDNEPPIYGKVFISIKPYFANILSKDQSARIIEFLRGKKILSITPELINPEYLQITLDVLFKYNRSATPLNGGELESAIRDLVSDYNKLSLQTFNGVFRYSSLTSKIDSYSSAILNSHIRVFVSKSFELNTTRFNNKIINFATKLIPDDAHVIVSCSPFMIGGVEMYLEDEEIVGDLYNRRIYTYYYNNATKTKSNANVGTLNVDTGVLMLDGIITDGPTMVTLDLMPASNDIAPKRNQLLQINMARLFVKAEVDTVAVGGSSLSTTYTTFKRDR